MPRDTAEKRDWPEVITSDTLAKNAHVGDAEIQRDIDDTQAEIDQYRRLQTAEEEIARTHPSEHERKLADFRATGRPFQIEERQKFIDFLKRLQAARLAASN